MLSFGGCGDLGGSREGDFLWKGRCGEGCAPSLEREEVWHFSAIRSAFFCLFLDSPLGEKTGRAETQFDSDYSGGERCFNIFHLQVRELDTLKSCD